VYTWFCWVKLREKDNLENSGIDERIVLIWIFRMWEGRRGVDSYGS